MTPTGPSLPRASLVVNPKAGVADGEPVERLRERLAEHFELTVRETSQEHDADACAHEALAAGDRLVIAAGGDGTVSAVASVLAGGEVPLGIIPRGTSNSIAAALGIPADEDGAFAVLLAGHTRAIDLARVDGRIAVLACSVGLHAETIGETSRESKNRWGVLAYVATGIKKLTELQPFEIEIETDRHRVRCKAVAVTVANLAPIKSVLAQGPSMVRGDDGLLDVTIVAATSLATAVAAGFDLLRTAALQEPATHDDVGYFSSRKLRIVAEPPQHVIVDGEPFGMTPVAIECLPRGLLVLAPEAEDVWTSPEVKLDSLPDVEVERK